MNYEDYSTIDPETKTGLIGVDRGMYIVRVDGKQIGKIFADDYAYAYSQYGEVLRDYYKNEEEEDKPGALVNTSDGSYWLTRGLPQTTGMQLQIEEAVI